MNADKHFFSAGSCPYGFVCTGFVPAPWEAGRQGDEKPLQGPQLWPWAQGTKALSPGQPGLPEARGDTPSMDRGVTGCSPCTCCCSFLERALGTACEEDPRDLCSFLLSATAGLGTSTPNSDQPHIRAAVPSGFPPRLLLGSALSIPRLHLLPVLPRCHRTSGWSPVTQGQLWGCLCCSVWGVSGCQRHRWLIQGCQGHRWLPSSF